MKYRVAAPVKNEKTGKTHWANLGVGWSKDTGAISIRLNSLPMGSEVFLFPDDGKQQRTREPGDDDVPY